jgi:hypothetical protein
MVKGRKSGRDGKRGFRVERFTDFAIGMPTDFNEEPEIRYHVLTGKAYIVRRWKGCAAAREVALETVTELAGAPSTGGLAQEGWYDATGQYQGPIPEADLGLLKS